MNALIKYKEVLSNAKQMLRLNSTSNDVWLMNLIMMGARDLNSPETLVIANCFVNVCDNKFYMPEDCKTLLAIRCQNSCVQDVFVDVDFFSSCGCNGNYGWNNMRRAVTINGRWVTFLNNWYSSANNGLTVDQAMYPNQCCDENTVEISYRKVWTDCDGDIVINEEAYTHLSMYAAYWFALSYRENYSPDQIKAWGQHATLQGNRVRSAAARRKFLQQQAQITNIMYTVVQRGGSLGGLSGNWGGIPPFWASQFNSIPPSN